MPDPKREKMFEVTLLFMLSNLKSTLKIQSGLISLDEKEKARRIQFHHHCLTSVFYLCLYRAKRMAKRKRRRRRGRKRRKSLLNVLDCQFDGEMRRARHIIVMDDNGWKINIIYTSRLIKLNGIEFSNRLDGEAGGGNEG